MGIPQLGYCLLWGQDGPPQSAELGPIGSCIHPGPGHDLGEPSRIHDVVLLVDMVITVLLSCAAIPDLLQALEPVLNNACSVARSSILDASSPLLFNQDHAAPGCSPTATCCYSRSSPTMTFCADREFLSWGLLLVDVRPIAALASASLAPVFPAPAPDFTPLAATD